MFLWLPTDARRRRLAIFSGHFGHFYFGVCVQEKYEIKKVWDWRGSASSLLHPFRSDIFYARRAVRSEDSLVKNLSWRSSVTPDSLRFGWFLFWKRELRERTLGENFHSLDMLRSHTKRRKQCSDLEHIDRNGQVCGAVKTIFTSQTALHNRSPGKKF